MYFVHSQCSFLCSIKNLLFLHEQKSISSWHCHHYQLFMIRPFFHANFVFLYVIAPSCVLFTLRHCPRREPDYVFWLQCLPVQPTSWPFPDPSPREHSLHQLTRPVALTISICHLLIDPIVFDKLRHRKDQQISYAENNQTFLAFMEVDIAILFQHNYETK